MMVLSFEEFVSREDEFWDAGERLLDERGIWSNGTMTQLSLYAEIAYLRDFIAQGEHIVLDGGAL